MLILLAGAIRLSPSARRIDAGRRLDRGGCEAVAVHPATLSFSASCKSRDIWRSAASAAHAEAVPDSGRRELHEKSMARFRH
jgi:hypothetical protein